MFGFCFDYIGFQSVLFAVKKSNLMMLRFPFWISITFSFLNVELFSSFNLSTNINNNRYKILYCFLITVCFFQCCAKGNSTISNARTSLSSSRVVSNLIENIKYILFISSNTPRHVFTCNKPVNVVQVRPSSSYVCWDVDLIKYNYSGVKYFS